MGYGTGAIMAVPAHDERDFEFAHEFELPILGVIRPPDAWFAERGLEIDAPAATWPEAFIGDGVAMRSANEHVSLDGLSVVDAKAAINGWLEAETLGAPDGHLQAARLAVQPSALLGRAVPDRLRRAWPPDRAPGVDAAGRAAGDRRLRAAHRRTRRGEPSRPSAGSRRRLGDGRRRPRAARLGRRQHWDGHLRARAQHDAAVGRLLLVLPAVPRPDERERDGLPGGRAVLDGHREWGSRPLRRRGRARGAAPSLRAVLAQGAVRPREGAHA